MTDPYAILRVPPTATLEEVKSAYRKLAKTCHPDLHPDDETARARFQEITSAYEKIEKGGGKSSSDDPNWFSFGGGFASFEEMLRRAHYEQQRNPNTQATCVITLENAFQGCNVDLQVQHSGKTFQVAIPPGVKNGHRMRVAGAGKTEEGDLILTIRIADHPTFWLHGPMLCRNIEVDALLACAGGEMETTGLMGDSITVTVPRGIQAGEYIIIPGHGMPIEGGRADMVVVIQIVVPREITTQHRQSIKTLKELLASQKKAV